jgi:hypothetical protein
MSLEETVGYINRYLRQDYGDEAVVGYVDADAPEMTEYPGLAEAAARGRALPLVLVGDEVKSPSVLSFAWIVSELKGLGVVE